MLKFSACAILGFLGSAYLATANSPVQSIYLAVAQAVTITPQTATGPRPPIAPPAQGGVDAVLRCSTLDVSSCYLDGDSETAKVTGLEVSIQGVGSNIEVSPSTQPRVPPR